MATVSEQAIAIETQKKFREFAWENYTKRVAWDKTADKYYLESRDGFWTPYSLDLLRKHLDESGFFGWIFSAFSVSAIEFVMSPRIS